MDPRAGVVSVENLAFTGIGSPYRPARSEWLYRLRYPGPRPDLIEALKSPLNYKRGNSLYLKVK